MMAEKLTKEYVINEQHDLKYVRGDDYWTTLGSLCYEFAEGIAEGLYTEEEAKEIAKLITE